MSFYIEDEDDEIIVINNSIDRAVVIVGEGNDVDEEGETGGWGEGCSQVNDHHFLDSR